jgi:hypothetical protein
MATWHLTTARASTHARFEHAQLLAGDEARRIAENIAKLPHVLGWP